MTPMTHHQIATSRLRVLGRHVRRPLARDRRRRPTSSPKPEVHLAAPMEPLWAPVIIRLATAGDRPALERLAELDSSEGLSGPALIGELHQRPVAALGLSDDRVVADPFTRTSEVLELLRLRARQLAVRQGRRR